jgi:hypothetical protein
MFQELVQHLKPYNIDLIDLAIVELVADGVSELRAISDSLGQGRDKIQYAYARVKNLQSKGWLASPIASPLSKRFRLRKLTPEGKKRMKKIRVMVQAEFCGGQEDSR